MDIRTALAIYNKPWLIEPNAALRLLSYWEAGVYGKVDFDKSFLKTSQEDKQGDEVQQLFDRLNAVDGVVVAPTNKWDFKEFEGFKGNRTAVIPITGPLMKADFCGDFGTSSLRSVLKMAYSEKSIESIVLFMDSPGGTVDGTEAFAQEIEAGRQHKNIISFNDGMICSACYWMASASDTIIAGEDTAITGSIGTMMSITDYTKYREEMGIILREYNATESKDKNKVFRDARDGDGKMLIQQYLDPANNVFLSSVKRNRPQVLSASDENVLTGKVYYTQDAIKYGLIDAKESYDSTINIAMEMAPKKNKKTFVMSKNIAFLTALTVAMAESFEVVEGGFMLTEDQLNKIDAQLKEDATTKRTQANTIETLEATAAANDVDALKAQIQTLTETNATLTTENETLTQQLEDAKNGAGLFTASPGSKQDPAAAHEENEPSAQEQYEKMPHVRDDD